VPNQHLLILLPAPDFVSGLSDDDYVYFFFREQAVEYINCGKVRTEKHITDDIGPKRAATCQRPA
jgi:hypothetical protein